MKCNLKVLLLANFIFLASVIASINTSFAQQPSQGSSKTSLSIQQHEFIKAATKQIKNKELNAFHRSQYDYWDARVLADYWGQSVIEAKARIGRKILWGKYDVSILEQFLVDARIQGLQSLQGNRTLKLYSESKYRYNDAEKLAAVWGERSPWEAKVRIEKNLILGQQEVIEKALREWTPAR